MPKRKREVNVESFVFQQSLLLQLPSELRNQIYEEFVVDESLSIRDGQILYSSPLSLVCRQVRHEYRQIYFDEAPYFAKAVNIFASNYISNGLGECLSALPLPNPPSQVTFRIDMFLDNTWRREDLRSFLTYMAVSPNKEFLRLHASSDWRFGKHDIRNFVSYTISFDPRTFDVHLCRELLPRITWCHGTGTRADVHWEMIEVALKDALDKHDQRYMKSRRKRKARKAKKKTIEKENFMQLEAAGSL